MKNQDTLIFLHIPKTGGITLGGIIRRQYGQSTVYRIPRIPNDLSPIDEFKNVSDTQKEKIRVLEGHIPFGLHEYLPQPASYITLLRNPINRMISVYYFIRSRPDHILYDSINSQNMSLQDFICNDIASDLHNGQVRFLAGPEEDEAFIPSGPLTPVHLETAKKNLEEKFLLAGLTERFDESLILLRGLLGWRNIYYSRQNETPNRPDKKDIPRDILDLIEKHNEFDMALYRYVSDRFSESISQQGLFKMRLAAFKAQNWAYNKLRATKARVNQEKL